MDAFDNAFPELDTFDDATTGLGVFDNTISGLDVYECPMRAVATQLSLVVRLP